MKDESVYLGHIRDAISDIQTYASVDRATFIGDRMRQDAVIRKLEIIGEAVKQLSDGTRSRAPEIPWKRIAGMRDRLPLFEECFHCTSIVQGSVPLSAGRRAGPHVRGSTGTSCAAVRLSCACVRPPRVRVAGHRAIVVG